jgi:hypothetical protein
VVSVLDHAGATKERIMTAAAGTGSVLDQAVEPDGAGA